MTNIHLKITNMPSARTTHHHGGRLCTKHCATACPATVPSITHCALDATQKAPPQSPLIQTAKQAQPTGVPCLNISVSSTVPKGTTPATNKAPARQPDALELENAERLFNPDLSAIFVNTPALRIVSMSPHMGVVTGTLQKQTLILSTTTRRVVAAKIYDLDTMSLTTMTVNAVVRVKGARKRQAW